MKTTHAVLLAAVALGAAVVAIRHGRGRSAEPAVILVTTTSTYDTGLLDVLLPPFERDCGCQVKVLAVGTGQALAMGGRGDADVALVHAPDLERARVAAGDFVRRRPVMHSDFVVVGPDDDPAAIADAEDAAAAFARIADAGALFASRGDASGTHHREQQVWTAAGRQPPADAGYLEVGQGMGATLLVASERRAYTLTDRGTFLALRQRLDLTVLVEGDPLLVNPYHVMEVAPARSGERGHPELARRLADYLVSDAAQALIGSFGVERFGQPLFRPGPAPGAPADDPASWN